MRNSPALLILAAGLGSRYGGLKQIDPVGPEGETVLDYAVFDALRAGFGRVVFVIRREFAEVFREQIGAKYAGRVPVDYVYQEIEDLPAGGGGSSFAPRSGASADTASPWREKPWGTGHAVWSARDAVRENFAAINADDFYGADAFAQLAGFLGRAEPGAARYAMVGFRLAGTLSEHGAVSRGVGMAVADRLQSLVEQTGIARDEVGPGRKFSGEEIVSMNCWGFTPALFPALDTEFRGFLAARGAEPKAEFYLPAAVSAMIGRGEAEVQVLRTGGSWFGITYRDDKPRVAAAIADLVRRGSYPPKLFP